jgi:uncharacterized iron-regulated membrane protein
MNRRFWVVAHRWAGLTLALFLAVAGFTGIFLAWSDELESMISPHLFQVSASYKGADMLSPSQLRDRILARYPGGIIDYMPLHFEEGRSVYLGVGRLDPHSHQQVAWSKDWDQLFVDPYTGEDLGTRRWGDIRQGTVNLMPFIYRLHYSLALGEYGSLAFGIAALIWTLDSFVGFYLTLPVRVRRKTGVATGEAGKLPNWGRRWRSSWLVRWRSSPYKINFDLHRAGGLWIWPMLLVFAWSSVAFNLTPVYMPIMKLLGAEDVREQFKPLASPRLNPKFDFPTAVRRGERLASMEMRRRHIGVDTSGSTDLYYMSAAGIYSYSFTSGRDFTNDGGRSRVVFDGDTGALRAIELPQGQNGANGFTNWIMALHMAQVWGLPYKIAVSLIGLLVTTLSVTGVIIWMRKRSARAGRKLRLSSRRAAMQSPEWPNDPRIDLSGH